MSTEQEIPETVTAEQPDKTDVSPPQPVPLQVDREATGMVHQAVVDYISTLPPAAKAATDAYFKQIINRCVVIAQT